MNKKPVIIFKDFSFSYTEGTCVLQKIDLEIYEGERILILGPSGCGKSTLGLCLNGIIPHVIDGRTSGSLKVCGMETEKTPVSVLSQKTGIVFQDPESQFCMLKVNDEMAFGLENLKIERPLIIKETESALARVQMQDCGKMFLNHLSGGMKQRVALAAILAINQPIMLFDEPTSNLDPRGTGDMAEIIRGMPPEKTLIIIEHKLDYFIDIFDRIVVIDGSGRVAAADKTEKILTDKEPVLKELGVWLPRIPRCINSIAKSTGYLMGESNKSLPLNIEDAKKAIISSPFSEKIISIIGNEVRDEIVPPVPQQVIQDNRETVQVISVRNLGFKYEGTGKMVLKDINLTIDRGDFIAVAGQNGSGKTTLAKILTGLLKPGPGSSVTVRNPATNPENASGLPGKSGTGKGDVLDFTGFVFQNPEHQFLEDTVYDEVLFGLRTTPGKTGLPDNALVDKKTGGILKLMGLEGFKDRNPFSLSQGQKRRLSVASILVMDHQILILDEPTFGQDYINTTELMDILVDYNRRGKTIIIITHDMNLVFRYCHKVAVLKEGALAYYGSTVELLGRGDILEECGLDVPPLFKLYHEVKGNAFF